MTANQYIEERIRSLISIFNDIQIKYWIYFEYKTHLVEVIPAEFMVQNEDYFKEEAQIIEQFNELFPSENIFFISDDSPIQIQHPDLVLGVGTP